jgi:hypothetical protein
MMKQGVHHHKVGLAEFFRRSFVEFALVKLSEPTELSVRKLDISLVDVKPMINNWLVKILKNVTRPTADIEDRRSRR